MNAARRISRSADAAEAARRAVGASLGSGAAVVLAASDGRQAARRDAGHHFLLDQGAPPS